MIDLVPAIDSEGVLATTAAVLGTSREPRRSPLETIVEWCRGRSLLLVFDNCEHVSSAARLRSTAATDLLRLDEFLAIRHRANSGGRHGTLEATIDWSYRMLDGEHRSVFDRLAVFAGTFDLAAVLAVSLGEGGDAGAARIGELIADLVDTSMVVATRGDEGMRYRLLETMRNFALDRLGARTASARASHLLHYCQVALRTAALWASPSQLVAEDVFDLEWDNLRAALVWAIERGDAHACDVIVASTGPMAHSRIRDEHADWVADVLASDRIEAGVEVLTAAANWALVHNDVEGVIELAYRAIEAHRRPTIPTRRWRLLVSITAVAAADASVADAGVAPGSSDEQAATNANEAAMNRLANVRACMCSTMTAGGPHRQRVPLDCAARWRPASAASATCSSPC